MAAGKPKEAEESLRECLEIFAESPEIQPNAYFINCNLLAETMIAQSKKMPKRPSFFGVSGTSDARKLFREHLLTFLPCWGDGDNAGQGPGRTETF